MVANFRFLKIWNFGAFWVVRSLYPHFSIVDPAKGYIYNKFWFSERVSSERCAGLVLGEENLLYWNALILLEMPSNILKAFDCNNKYKVYLLKSTYDRHLRKHLQFSSSEEPWVGIFTLSYDELCQHICDTLTTPNRQDGENDKCSYTKYFEKPIGVSNDKSFHYYRLRVVFVKYIARNGAICYKIITCYPFWK